MTRPKAVAPFEGILQLRPATEAVLSFLEKEIHSNKQFQVTYQTNSKNNFVDLYVAKQRSLLAVAKKLKARFPGELITSRKLHTRNRTTGKLVYRVTAVFKPLLFKRGDVVIHKRAEYTVQVIGKNQVKLKDPNSGKVFWAKLADVRTTQ